MAIRRRGLFMTSQSYCGSRGLTIWKTLTWLMGVIDVYWLDRVPSSGKWSSLPIPARRIQHRVDA